MSKKFLNKDFLRGLVVGYGLMSLTLSYVAWILKLYAIAFVSVTTFILLLFVLWKIAKEMKDG